MTPLQDLTDNLMVTILDNHSLVQRAATSRDNGTRHLAAINLRILISEQLWQHVDSKDST